MKTAKHDMFRLVIYVTCIGFFFGFTRMQLINKIFMCARKSSYITD